jgi:catechol 2,3-dioxygenase-like lactoylglutathione lyase family enzyme
LNIKLDHAVIHVSDWDKSNEFYKKVLRAKVVRRGAGWAYKLGTVQLNVHGPGLSPTPLAKIPVVPGNSDLCFAYPGSVEDARQHLRKNGIEIELGPVQRNGVHGRGMSLYFRDPDGSLLEFICYNTPIAEG